jgi:3-deoxy-D-manno-octulosonic-acid transferase
MLVNGRLSSRSFGRYQRVRWFMQRLLKRLRACAMQSTADQERILALGADPQRCHVAGNLKFDAAAREVPGADLVALRASWGLTAETPLIIAGSTHPGEEEILLEAFEEVLKSLPDARLLVAPRHVERAPEVAALVRQRGLDLRRRGESGAARVLLLDTMGELARTYAIADVAYVGGSLAPHGGQNVLEPAVYGVAAVFGPHMFNFAEICERLLAVDGAWQVQHGKELAQALLSLLTDPSRRRKMGERAQAIIAENRGAVDRHLEIIGDVLREAGLPGE